MLIHEKIPLERDDIVDFCRRNQIRRLSLFGSLLSERFGENSDVDLLVEFEEGAKVSLFDVGGMMHELTEKLGRQVDIRTPNDLSRSFRAQVMAEAEVIYEA